MTCPADAALVASPEVRLGTTEAEIRDQVAEVKRLQRRSEQKEVAWAAASKEKWADAKVVWDAPGKHLAAEKQLVAAQQELAAAQQELAALRSKEQNLLGQLSSPGKGSRW